MPTGGNVIYGVAHQHTGGIGFTLYREDGQFLCSSIPTYRQEKEAGSEEGYIVRMSTWYPNLGSVKISDGETIVLESIYNRSQSHGGVMGLFYILVADDMSPNNPNSVVHSPVEVLVVGGGDGGVLREISCHNTVELIDICEIDKMVIVSQLLALRILVCNLHIADVVEFLRNVLEGKYDAIIVDSSDPVGSNLNLEDTRSVAEALARSKQRLMKHLMGMQTKNT